MMKCTKCYDRRVIWITGDFGMSTAKPCPKCNPDGQFVRNQIEAIEKSRRKEQKNGK